MKIKCFVVKLAALERDKERKKDGDPNDGSQRPRQGLLDWTAGRTGALGLRASTHGANQQ